MNYVWRQVASGIHWMPPYRCWLFVALLQIALPLCVESYAATAQSQPREAVLEQFRTQCRAKYQSLRGHGQHETVAARVRSCVDDKIRTFAWESAAASPSSSVELKLLEFTPWLAKPNSGPAAAKGVIYFVNGFSSGRGSDEFQIAPYFIKSFSESGWDVISAKIPKQQEGYKGALLLPGGSAFVGRRLAELKALGYRRVILAGHSWGAWLAPIVAQNSKVAIDALILSGPAAYGPDKLRENGRPNPTFNLNLNEFGALMSKVSVPTVLILPNDTVFEPNAIARGDLAEKQFTDAKLPHLVLAKPPGFKGHYAGWLPFFDFAFGACIEAFLNDPQSKPCALPQRRNVDFRAILDLKEVAESEHKQIVSGDDLSGRKFVVYTLEDFDNKHFDFVSSKARVTMASERRFRDNFSVQNGILCSGGSSGCSVLIEWAPHQILEFDQKSSKLKAWWVERS